MNLLKRALSNFVEFDEKPATTKVAPSVPVQVSAPVTVPVFKAQQVQINSEEFEKFKKHFEDLMENANLPGPDYFEFLKVEDKLTQHIADEKTRFVSAFASLCVSGVTKEVLLNSAAKYIEIIEKDRAGFEAALKSKIETEIGGRKTQIADAQKKIEITNSQIQELTKTIVEQQALITELTKQTDEVENAIRKNAEGFSVAHKAMVETIQSDIQKIQTVL